jgi:VanZ family protein
MVRLLLSPVVLRALFWLCALGVLVLALVPPARIVPTTLWDKADHVLAFAVLALLGRSAYPDAGRALWLGLVAYGGAIELLQALTPYRTGDFADLGADALGVLVGWKLAGTLSRRPGPDSPGGSS